MTDFKPNDRVRINWPLDDELHGRTGTETVGVWADCLDRIQVIGADTSHLYVDGLIKSCTVGDAAVVAAVHVRRQMLIDVACSRHGHLTTYGYDRGTTNAELEIMRDHAGQSAYIHATDCHADALDRGVTS